MKTKITLSIFIFLLFVLSTGCAHKKNAKGQEDVIHVIADSSEYVFLQDALQKTFGRIIHTPQPEEIFKIKRHSVNELNGLQLKKNILIVAPINSGSYTSKYIQSIVNDDVKKMYENDSAFVINKYDLWAENQLVMILSASNIDVLKEKILEKNNDLFYNFREISNKRLAKGLYNRRFEQKDIEAKFITKYKWMIYMQADYQVALEKPEDNFVWLRRGVNTDMERWIFIHWIENSTPDLLNVDSVSAVRNELTKKYYRTTDDQAYVELYDDYKLSKEVNFNDKYAIMTQGLWRFNDQSMGGPFINYAFYDENSRRVYILDASILAPKYYKKSLIQQVDVLLHSFKTEAEIDPVMKEEILEELPE